MRSIAHFLLRLLGPLMTFGIVRSGIENLEMFFSALVGRGGGSGWDSKDQTAALAKKIEPRPNMVVLDVGANNGKWVSELDEIIKRHYPNYHLFECAPYCFKPLEKRSGNFPNAVVIKKAVSDKDGQTTLYLPDVGSGLASVHRRSDTSVRQYTYNEIAVDTITIDTYLSENNIDRVDVLKIDVEGHEMAVLNGASNAFKKRVVRTIMFEFGSANVNSRTYFRDFWNFFSDKGYSVYRIIPGGKVIHVEQYSDRLEYFRGASNYIATIES